MSQAPANPVCSEKARLYLRLQMTEQVGPIRLQNLLKHFGTVEAVLAASQAELQRVEGIGPITAKAIFGVRAADAETERELARAADCDVRIICLEDDSYPAPLKHIADPPICLYVRGELIPTDTVAVGIVGTRKCSHYGREQAARFGELLAQAGFTVVSGLARGVDGAAHRGALRAGGRTLAVLGNGLSGIYPPEHEELAADIAGRGAVISELPIDASPEAKNFPGRNRIIAGLSLGVLVIEAGKRSGALITARLAVEYNREAFALPGNVDRPDWTAGTNALIRDGTAKLVTCLEDILEELGEVGRIMTPTSRSVPATQAAPTRSARTAGNPSLPLFDAGGPDALTAGRQQVLDAIAAGSVEADDICASTGLPAGTVFAAITQLQITGVIQRLPGNRLQLRTGAGAGDRV